MDQALFTLPILPGKTEAARAFLQEMDGPRKQELAACGQSVGITKEVWAIQQTPQGDIFVAYMAGDEHRPGVRAGRRLPERVRSLVQAADAGDDRRGSEHAAARAHQ